MQTILKGKYNIIKDDQGKACNWVGLGNDEKVQILLPGWGVGIRTLYRLLHLFSGPRLYSSNLLGYIWGVQKLAAPQH